MNQEWTRVHRLRLRSEHARPVMSDDAPRMCEMQVSNQDTWTKGRTTLWAVTQ
jgi:hypothetical protein